jgi:hypothetical protein
VVLLVLEERLVVVLLQVVWPRFQVVVVELEVEVAAGEENDEVVLVVVVV